MIKNIINEIWKRLIKNNNINNFSSEKTLVFHFTWLLKEELKEEMTSLDFEKQLFQNFSDGTFLDLYFEYNNQKIGIEFKFPKRSAKGYSNSTQTRVKCINDIKRLTYLVNEGIIDLGVFLMASDEKAYMFEGNKKIEPNFKTYNKVTYEKDLFFPYNSKASKEDVKCLNNIVFKWHNTDNFRLKNEVAYIEPIFVFKTNDMMNKEQELLTLQNEVKAYYKELSQDKNLKNIYFKNLEEEIDENLYYKIFFSKMSFNADILFIGINPGGGEYCCDTSPLEEFEYLEAGPDYQLGYNTKKAFILAGYENLLQDLDKANKVVKTNLYYLVTKNVSHLESFERNIPFDTRDNFLKNHVQWTHKIIQLCQPKLIIFEGKELDKHCPPFSSETVSIEVSETCHRYIFKNGSYGLLYSRHGSTILDIEHFASLLKIELDTIYKQ